MIEGMQVSKVPSRSSSGVMGRMFAPSDVSEARAEVCKACESYKIGLCTECSCPVFTKTRMASAVCPRNKWPSVAINLG